MIYGIMKAKLVYFCVPCCQGIMMVIQTIVCLLAFGAAVQAAYPFGEFRSDSDFELTGLTERTNLDDPAYRLKDNIQPTYFDVALDVYLNESRFDGVVQIEVDVNEENLTQIVLHQKVVSILSVSVFDSTNQPVALQFPGPFETDSYYEILMINLAVPLSIGQYTLVISYTGQINENPFDRGFYKGYYYYEDEKREYATTQFQPYHARKAFPCFDEPQFKSRFVLSITRDSSLSQSYSNMPISNTEVLPNGRTKETFLPTPIISAYLIAFHVSDFEETTATSTAAAPFGIISRPGVTNQHAYAAQIGVDITFQLSNYLGIDYYTTGQGSQMKNDHIALPDFPSGAMENWGMVNYREAYLLFDEANTNLNSKLTIATIMAHELGHKWFGNLVTCFWWSNLWLNESFASFFEYFGAHLADPSLELADQFVVDYVHSALNYDAGAGANPMNWTGVVTNPSISAHFSTASYAKGASVLRMLEHFVGENTFPNALRYYLRDNSHGLGTPEAMYDSFRTAVAEDSTYTQNYGNLDIGDVFDSWVQNAGSPVLNVDVDTDTGLITVSQERFLLSGATPATQVWQVPITWTHSGNLDFSSTKPSFVLTTQTTTIENTPGDYWVVFNIQQSGLYRVNYDDRNWQMLAEALRDNKDQIHRLNRAQIVNDVLHFFRAGKISEERAFDVLEFLKDEEDYYVWNGALAQLNIIRRRFEHIPDAHKLFVDYKLELMEYAIGQVGFNEEPDEPVSTTLNRVALLDYACTYEMEACVNDAVDKWKAWREDETNLVPPNLRRHVYCSGIREGDASDYNFLYQKYNTSENAADMVVMLRALPCTKDTTSLVHYLQQTMYNDRIRNHDKSNAWTFALAGNQDNIKTVLSFLYTNYQAIRDTHGGQDRLDTQISALSTYLTDYNDIVEFQTWIYANQVDLGSSFDVGKSVVATAMSNLEWGNEAVVEVYSVLRSRNSAGIVTLSISLIFTAFLAQILK